MTPTVLTSLVFYGMKLYGNREKAYEFISKPQLDRNSQIALWKLIHTLLVAYRIVSISHQSVA